MPSIINDDNEIVRFDSANIAPPILASIIEDNYSDVPHAE